ncbi:MAG: bifunctional UDP-N-acetylglucosamine diphosphorylase/glucosamine-1-phosphate N-acetyltransferase GlmU [Gammaproteobacteria bacterium]|nr:bifunctional UDP-N-acetylglucosamine diphosphorylase/glucosamine-1-phosphate N-acetyltransferase GlmU [Gammaproteobacteria bacterium]MBQ0839254.1 bifunctional UDP-N-acetylglucosamine diphosphorylase/glucosamine-1-phosphate N-acetyltransferase GlmU [Gammaproteobacteria bacterium]
MLLDVLVLAAGKGTRMRSELPKVLHPLAGKPLLAHVFSSVEGLDGAAINVIVGHGKEQIQATFAGQPLNWIEQTSQLGTAHAVLQAIPALRDEAKVLIVYGDVPLIESSTLEKMLAGVDRDAMALLTVTLPDPSGYGRILRNPTGDVIGIVEQKDAAPEQLQISEVNTGVMAMTAADLKTWLPQIDNNNAQQEYYLTDVISLARAAGRRINTYQPAAQEEVEGVNSRAQLVALERYYQRQKANSLLDCGVTIIDPTRFDCRGELVTGEDVVIDINCIFEGTNSIGNQVSIGPSCVIKDAIIGDRVIIKANTVIEGPVTLEADVQVGPFARLRPHTVLAEGAKVGNFVETKKAQIGPGSKISHLSYVGDAVLGSEVNVGAGTITCNYDGVNKHLTEIDDGAFIGSNTSLVAPVVVGKNATVGAGSTISRDVPDDSLAIARGKQRTIDTWKRPEKN